MTRGPNTTPRYMNTVVVGRQAISTANQARDGSGTIATLLTAGAEGQRVDRVVFKATGTVTAGMVRVFTRVAAGTWRLLAEKNVAALVAAAGAPPVETWGGLINATAANVGYVDLSDENGGHIFNLAPTDELGVSTNNAEEFIATAIAGDY